MLPPQYTSKPTGAPRLRFSKALPMAPGSASKIFWGFVFCGVCFTWGLSESLNLKLDEKLAEQLPTLPTIAMPKMDIPKITIPNLPSAPDFSDIKKAAYQQSERIQKAEAQVKAPAFKAGEMIITTTNPTPFYGQTSTEGRSIGSIGQNSPLRVAEVKGEWVAVKGGTKTFWIQQAHVKAAQ